MISTDLNGVSWCTAGFLNRNEILPTFVVRTYSFDGVTGSMALIFGVGVRDIFLESLDLSHEILHMCTELF